MALYTLLDVVQLTLSALDSDEVQRIADSVESLQIANIARIVYDDITTRIELPEEYTIFQLTPSNSTDRPCIMYVPASVNKMEWIKYDTREDGEPFPNFQMMEYRKLDDFINRQQEYLKNEQANAGVQTITKANGDTISFVYGNDRNPRSYTSFDDNTLVFDFYDKNRESTLQRTHTMCSGWMKPEFRMEDGFKPAFDDQIHLLWLHETKAKAFAELKQTQNQNTELDARRVKIRTQQDKRKIPMTSLGELDNLPRYGR